MKSSIAATLGSISMLILAACSSPSQAEGTDDIDQSQDALISFPAAAYANATMVAYGSSATRRFATANGFVAVKFRGRAGDVVRFTVTAARPTVSYLVFNQRNVAALRNSSDPVGAYRYTLTADGEYFIMMRSSDRAAANIRVSLERLASASGGLFTTAEIEAASSPGSMPWVTLLDGGTPPITAISYRRCVAATGCANVRSARIMHSSLEQAGFPSRQSLIVSDLGLQIGLDARTTPSGQAMGLLTFAGLVARGLTAEVIDPSTSLRQDESYTTSKYLPFDVAQATSQAGTFRLLVSDPTVSAQPFPITAQYKVSLSKTNAHIEISAEQIRTGAQWTEYYASVDRPMNALLPTPQVGAVPPPTNGDLLSTDRTPLDDEEVLSRFAAGEVDLKVFDPHAIGSQTLTSYFDAGTNGSRACGPRTGCSAWPTPARDAFSAANVFAGGFTSLSEQSYITLHVVNEDSYELRVRTSESEPEISIPIESGRGHIEGAYGARNYTVTVTSEGVRFDAPFEYVRTPLEYATLNLQDQLEAESGYSFDTYYYPSLLIRFNQNWN